MKSSYIRDELKHVRLVHFSLVILCGTMLYLITASWSDAPQLYRELTHLRRFLEELQRSAVPLWEIDPKLETLVEDQILQALQGLTSDQFRWWRDDFSSSTKPSLGCIWTSAQRDIKKPSLFELTKVVTEDRCQFLRPIRVEGDASGMSRWIRQHLKGTNVSGPFVAAFVIQAGTKEGSGNSGKILLRIHSWTRGNREHPEPYVFDDDQEFAVSVTVQPEYAALPKDWLAERFPVISRHRDELGDRSLENALSWTAGQRAQGIEPLKPSVFGIEVKGAHVGIVGPVVIVTTLVYLLAYLSHLKALVKAQAKTVEESVGFVSPWLGSTQNWLGLIVTAVTVAVLPTGSIFLSLWRLAGWPVVLCGFAGVLVGLVPGIVIVSNGVYIAKGRVEGDALLDSEGS